MTRILALLLLATQATAQDTHQLERSTTTLTVSERKGVVAEVHFLNSNSDKNHVTEQFTLSLGGLTVAVDMTVGTADPDTIIVEVPDGLIAVPRRLTIADGTRGVVLIMPLQSVGM